MDGEAPGGAGRQPPERRDIRSRGGPAARPDGDGGGGLAGEVSRGGRECAPKSAQGRAD